MNAEISLGDLGISIGRGPVLPAPTLHAESGRELTVEDLGLLATTSIGSKAPGIKKLREAHHQAARLLANGSRPGEVSAMTGFSLSRLSTLQADPTFAELQAHYAEVANTRFADVQERMVVLGLSASEELLERIIESPDSVTNKELREILQAALDRGGHSPVTRKESVTAVLTAEDLRAMKEQSKGAIIIDKAEIYEQKQEQSPKLLPNDPETGVGETSPDGSLGEQEAAGERGESEGAGV